MSNSAACAVREAKDVTAKEASECAICGVARSGYVDLFGVVAAWRVRQVSSRAGWPVSRKEAGAARGSD